MKLLEVATPIVKPKTKEFRRVGSYPDNSIRDMFGDNKAHEELLGMGSGITTLRSKGNEVYVLVYAVDLVNNKRYCRVNRRTYGEDHHNFEYANQYIQEKLKFDYYIEDKAVNAQGNETRVYYLEESTSGNEA